MFIVAAKVCEINTGGEVAEQKEKLQRCAEEPLESLAECDLHIYGRKLPVAMERTTEKKKS